MRRKLEQILAGSPPHMVGNGFRVRNYFPNGNRLGKRISPFFLLDYNPPFEFPPSAEPPGVGVHPHRGFETVTLALSGAVAHHDSAGNSGEIGPGDVQWMTAGSGVLHKEYHSEEFAESGGIFQMLQLWVNLPKAHKMHPPRYQGLKGADMPKVRITDDSALTLVAGSFEGKNGPAKTFSPLSFFVLDLAAGDSFEATYPSTWNTAYLITKGTLQVNEAQRAEAEDLCLFENADGSIHVQALENAQVVILSGEQIDEPVAHYGPFVMNTVEELQEAVADFQSGKFGSLE